MVETEEGVVVVVVAVVVVAVVVEGMVVVVAGAMVVVVVAEVEAQKPVTGGVAAVVAVESPRPVSNWHVWAPNHVAQGTIRMESIVMR